MKTKVLLSLIILSCLNFINAQITVTKFEYRSFDTSILRATIDFQASEQPAQYKVSELPDLSDAQWENYTGNRIYPLIKGCDNITLYFQVKNSSGEVSPIVNTSFTVTKPNPSIYFHINGGATQTDSDDVVLSLNYSNAVEYNVTGPNDQNTDWYPIKDTVNYTLKGSEPNHVLVVKARNSCGVIQDAASHIFRIPPPPQITKLECSNSIYSDRNVVTSSGTYIQIISENSPTEMMFSEKADFAGASWQAFTQIYYVPNPGLADRRIYVKVKNQSGESSVSHIDIKFLRYLPVTTIQLNNGSSRTNNRRVLVTISSSGNPTHYMLSEDINFTGATWKSIVSQVYFDLSESLGSKTLYVKSRTAYWQESDVRFDRITLYKTFRVTVDVNNSLWGYTDYSGASELTSGTSRLIKFTPQSNCEIDYVRVNGANLGPITEYQIENLDRNMNIQVYFRKKSKISTVQDPNGSINPITEWYISKFDTIIVRVFPKHSYDIQSVSLNENTPYYDFIMTEDGKARNYKLFNVTTDVIVSATFRKYYTIESGKTGNGTIEPLGTIETYGHQRYYITPDPGNLIESVIVDGVDKGIVTFYDFSNIKENSSIQANFKVQNTYNLFLDIGPGGSVTPNETVLYERDNTEFVVKADSGYAIDYVKIDGVDVGALGSGYSRTFTQINEDHSIEARFKRVYAIKIFHTDYGSIHPGYNGQILNCYEGDYQGFEVRPGYGVEYIDSVLVDGVNIGVVTEYTFTNVQSDHTIEAFFNIPDEYKYYTITASSNHPGGEISPNGSASINHGKSQTYHITNDTNTLLDSVVVDGVNKGKIKQYTFSNVTSEHSIAAYFSTDLRPKYVMTVNSSGPGKISGGLTSRVDTVREGEDYTIVHWPEKDKAVIHIEDNGVDKIDALVTGPEPVSSTDPRYYTLENVRENHTFDISFGDPLPRYKVSTWVQFNNGHYGGKVDPEGETWITQGRNLTVNITPDPGFYIDSMTVDHQNHTPVESYTFSNIVNNHYLGVWFSQKVFDSPDKNLFTVSELSKESFRLTWNSVSEAEGYKIALSEDNGNSYTEIDSTLTDTTKVFTSLYESKKYYVKVKSVAGIVESPYSLPFEVKTKSTIIIQEYSVVRSEEIISPDKLKIVFSSDTSGLMKIKYDTNYVYEKNISGLQIDSVSFVPDSFVSGINEVVFEIEKGLNQVDTLLQQLDLSWPEPRVRLEEFLDVRVDSAIVKYYLSQSGTVKYFVDNVLQKTKENQSGENQERVAISGVESNVKVILENSNGSGFVESAVNGIVNYHRLTINTDNLGTVTVNGESSDTLFVKENESEKITFIPNPGYRLWYIDINGVETELDSTVYTLKNVNENKNIRVFFRKNNWEEGIQRKTYAAGKVLIGTEAAHLDYSLLVDSKIKMKEVRVETGWSDYVFEEDYELISLSELTEYIRKKGHLPEIPDTKKVISNGISGGNISSRLLAKIEELTLYIIENQKRIKANKLMLEAVKYRK